MPLNRLQQIIAERKAAREQTDPSTEEGEESTVATRTRGEARKEAKEERKDERQEKVKERREYRLEKLNAMKEKVYANGLPEEWKKKVWEAAKGRIPWNKGKKFSEEEKKKMHGNRRRHSKFNEEQISEIRELYDLKLPAYKIAEKFGCSHHTVMKIVRFEGKYAKKD